MFGNCWVEPSQQATLGPDNALLTSVPHWTLPSSNLMLYTARGVDPRTNSLRRF